MVPVAVGAEVAGADDIAEPAARAARLGAEAQRAEDECRQMMVQFPNSKFVPKAQQMLRDTQEVLADKE